MPMEHWLYITTLVRITWKLKQTKASLEIYSIGVLCVCVFRDSSKKVQDGHSGWEENFGFWIRMTEHHHPDGERAWKLVSEV